MTMKKLILCLILLSNIQLTTACGWWPMGDEVRFSLFSQNLGGQDDMAPLFYSSQYFSDYEVNAYQGPKENLDEWAWYFRNKFTNEDIDEVIYKMSFAGDFVKYQRNPLFRHLSSGKSKEAKDYIIFAKQVELYLDYDPWNKKLYNVEELKALQQIAKTHAEFDSYWANDIQLRYAYQYITISYYLGDYSNVKLAYKLYFEQNTTTVLKYWAMLYYANVQDSNVNRLYLYSKIFTHAKSKCKYIYNHFTSNDSIVNLVLEKCKSNEERAGVLSVLAFKNPGPAKHQVKEIALLDPQLALLDILLIREVNKIEDWYLSAPYTSYYSGVYSNSYWDDYEYIQEINLAKDKQYIKDFVTDCEYIVNKHSPKNKSLWLTSIAYLHFLLGNESKSETYLNLAQNEYTCTNEIKAQIKVISLLNLVSSSKNWNVDFQNELYDRLVDLQEVKENIYNYDDFKNELMIALSRQFLNKGNIVLAALFEGKNKGKIDGYMDWREPKIQVFNVLDAEADSKVLDDFFELWNKPNKSKIEHYLLDSLDEYKWELTDLWATQYVREDKLEKALEIYKTIPEKFWTERDTFDMIYKHYGEFTSDPFESTFFGYHLNQKSDVHYTKPQFIQRLLDLKQKLKNREGNTAYTALLIGNAYYNMTVHGNSPYIVEYQMYRTISDEYGRKRPYFYDNSRALKYYKIAEKLAKNEKFGAFCYRMIVKCVSQNELFQEYAYGYNDMKIDPKIWTKFANKYPSHFNKLHYCDHFDDYANAWME